MAQLSITDEALRRRLIHDGCGTGEDRRLMMILKHITKFCQLDDTPEETTKLFNSIQKDLNLASSTNERYMRINLMYDRTFKDLELDIISKEEQLEKIRKDLARLVLELEYVEKLKKVNAYPDSQTTEKTMDGYEKRKQGLLQRMERQRINIHLLGQACKNLQKVMEPDDVEMACIAMDL